MDRACTKCGVSRPRTHEHFPPNKRRGDGLGSWCRACVAHGNREAKAKRLARPGGTEANLKYNREYIREWRKSEKYRAYHRERQRKVRATTRGRLNDRVSRCIACSLKRRAGAVKGSRSWEALVGYTNEALAAHIERQFGRGMSWDNMGEWHIDHIRPLASFEFVSADCPGFKAAWALTNLRPLWASDNLKKSYKLTLLL